MHRLVRDVLYHSLERAGGIELCRYWAEAAVRSANAAFADVEFKRAIKTLAGPDCGREAGGSG
jgi:hypothetical protein